MWTTAARTVRLLSDWRKALAAMPPTPPLPGSLPKPPDVPTSYLGGLAERVSASAPLGYEQQSALVADLKSSLRDPETADDARSLLQQLRKRRDLLASMADEIDELLDPTRSNSGLHRWSRRASNLSLGTHRASNSPTWSAKQVPVAIAVGVALGLFIGAAVFGILKARGLLVWAFEVRQEAMAQSNNVQPFIAAVHQFTKEAVVEPYKWDGYNHDLEGLKTLLTGYLNYVEQGGEVSQDETRQFVYDLRNAAHDTQIRACKKIAPDPPQKIYDLHCYKNFDDFLAIVDRIYGQTQASDGHRLSSEDLTANKRDITHWFACSIVSPNKNCPF